MKEAIVARDKRNDPAAFLDDAIGGFLVASCFIWQTFAL